MHLNIRMIYVDNVISELIYFISKNIEKHK